MTGKEKAKWQRSQLIVIVVIVLILLVSSLSLYLVSMNAANTQATQTQINAMTTLPGQDATAAAIEQTATWQVHNDSATTEASP